MRIAPTITMNSLSNYNVYNAGYSRSKNSSSVLVSLVKIVVSFILQQLL